MIERSIVCIDLKSFFASVECVERGLDPFTTPLVVADSRGNGSLTLAVTPYLKNLGVPSRGRIYNIPKNIKYLRVPPRMSLYQEYSKKVVNIFLDFVSPDDLHVYSIDESFLDLTDYLNYYKKDIYSLTKRILRTIYDKTGLTATAGIGPNLLLAKVAMDIEAKHTKDNIAHWTYDDVETKLWSIKPLSKMWSIGSRMEHHLNEMGARCIGDVAKLDKDKLRKKFGVIGEELIQHVNGIDNTKISDLNNQVVKEKSISNSQVLFKDYFYHNTPIIIYEILDNLARRLRTTNMLTSVVSLGITYSKTYGGGFHHSIKLPTPTDDENMIYKELMHIFDKYYHDEPIRIVSISLSGLTINDKLQLNLFESYEKIENNKNINKAIDKIKLKYGNNSILNGTSLLNDSTIKERNSKIGGHDA